MKDVQNEQDDRGKRIDKVGIRNLRVPFEAYVIEQDRACGKTVATLSLYVDLPHDKRGVNMSRFSEVVHDTLLHSGGATSSAVLYVAGQEVLQRMPVAEACYVKAKFPYFMVKTAPVSRRKGWLAYNCSVEVKCIREKVPLKTWVSIEVPYTSLCPCSKEISEAGAHNQRSTCKVTWIEGEGKLRFSLAFETVAALVEAAVPSPLYPTLKREDEKYVTEHAYARPKFVEDVARDVALVMDSHVEHRNAVGYIVVVNHFESIHSHDACAVIRGGEYIP